MFSFFWNPIEWDSLSKTQGTHYLRYPYCPRLLLISTAFPFRHEWLEVHRNFNESQCDVKRSLCCFAYIMYGETSGSISRIRYCVLYFTSTIVPGIPEGSIDRCITRGKFHEPFANRPECKLQLCSRISLRVTSHSIFRTTYRSSSSRALHEILRKPTEVVRKKEDTRVVGVPAYQQKTGTRIAHRSW